MDWSFVFAYGVLLFFLFIGHDHKPILSNPASSLDVAIWLETLRGTWELIGVALIRNFPSFRLQLPNP